MLHCVCVCMWMQTKLFQEAGVLTDEAFEALEEVFIRFDFDLDGVSVGGGSV